MPKILLRVIRLDTQLFGDLKNRKKKLFINKKEARNKIQIWTIHEVSRLKVSSFCYVQRLMHLFLKNNKNFAQITSYTLIVIQYFANGEMYN